MADDTSNRNASSKEKGKTKEALLVPPEERFWKRYSPNHEFPLSSATSAVIHLFVLGVMALGARTFANWGAPVDVDAIEIGGGGGSPNGEEGPRTGKFDKHESVSDAADSSVLQPKMPLRGEDLKEIEKLPNKIAKAPDDRRLIDED